MSNLEIKAARPEVTRQQNGLSAAHNDIVGQLQELLDVIDSLGYRLMPILISPDSDPNGKSLSEQEFATPERSEAAAYVRSEIFDRAALAVRQLRSLQSRIDL